MEKIVLIDGHSILHRAFYGLPDLTDAKGLHTNAIYGFLNILFKVLEEEQPEYLAVAFDVHAPTFRHEIYKAYKGTRKPMPEELREQVPVLKDVLRTMGIPVVEKAGLEADDILGTLSRRMEKEGVAVTIVSGDRDLLQLATDTILVRIPKTKAQGTTIEDYYADDVLAKYQVTPAEFIDLKALMGDSSDNIPGVPGVGEKTATKILTMYHSLDNAYAHLDEIKPPKAQKAMRENRELAFLCQNLVRIRVDAEFPFEKEEARIGNFYNRETYEFFKRLGFKRFLNRFEETEPTKETAEDFVVLKDADRIEDFFMELASKKSFGIAVTGEDTLLCVSVCFGDTTFCLLPCEGFSAENIGKSLLSAVSMAEKTSLFDLKSACHLLPFCEDHLPDDLLIGAYLLNPLISDHSYDEIAGEYLSLTVPSREELLGKKSLTESFKEEPDRVERLSMLMAMTAFHAAKPVLERLKEEGMESLYREIELPLVPVLASLEEVGIRVEKEELVSYGEKLSKGILELEQKIYAAAGETFNINSPKQLGQILFEKLGIPSGKKTKTGYSTAAGVLEKLAVSYPIVDDILRYRQLTKLKSTYADGLAGYIREDGRIHGHFNQMITATGRISSTDPNLQNIPVRMELGRQIRKVFVPEEGFVFVDADYSQIELRILASLSDDEQLIEAYRENKDIHRITASKVFHVPFDSVTPEQRRNAKAVNFGIVYGISGFGLSQGLSITRKEAQDYINSYFETYPNVKAYLDRTIEEAKKEGRVKTYFGRIRPIPELASGNFMQRQFGERVAMNSPIQGTAADIMKIAMIRAWKMLRERNLRSRIVLQVHDELLIETAEHEIDEVKEILTDAMMHAAQLAVPLEIDIETGKNWLEAK